MQALVHKFKFCASVLVKCYHLLLTPPYIRNKSYHFVLVPLYPIKMTKCIPYHME